MLDFETNFVDRKFLLKYRRFIWDEKRLKQLIFNEIFNKLVILQKMLLKLGFLSKKIEEVTVKLI